MIAIVLEGGSVKDVVTDDPKMLNVPFMVIDYDADDADLDDPDLALVPQADMHCELAYMKRGLTDKADINLRGIHRLTPRDVRQLWRKVA